MIENREDELKTNDVVLTLIKDTSATLSAITMISPEDTLYQKFLETYLSSLVLYYAELYEALKKLNPTMGENKILKFLDGSFEKDSSGKKIYNPFNTPSSLPGGFADVFGGGEKENKHKIYPIAQKLKKNLDSDNIRELYLNIIHTIDEISIHAKNVANSFVENSKHLTRLYFATLLNIEKKTGDRENDRKNFQEKMLAEIEIYKESYPKELKKETSLLNKLLWFITKLIPIISKKRRIALFSDYTETKIQLDSLKQITEFGLFSQNKEETEKKVAYSFLLKTLVY